MGHHFLFSAGVVCLFLYFYADLWLANRLLLCILGLFSDFLVYKPSGWLWLRNYGVENFFILATHSPVMAHFEIDDLKYPDIILYSSRWVRYINLINVRPNTSYWFTILGNWSFHEFGNDILLSYNRVGASSMIEPFIVIWKCSKLLFDANKSSSDWFQLCLRTTIAIGGDSLDTGYNFGFC